MATGTLKGVKRKTVSVTVPAYVETGEGSTGLAVDRIISIILKKNDDVYWTPIIYSLLGDGKIEVRVTAANQPPSVNRNYSFYVYYI